MNPYEAPQTTKSSEPQGNRGPSTLFYVLAGIVVAVLFLMSFLLMDNNEPSNILPVVAPAVTPR